MAEVQDEGESLTPTPRTSPPSELRQSGLSDAAALHEIEFCPDLLAAAGNTPDEARQTRALLRRWRRLGHPSPGSLRPQNSSASAEAPSAAESHPQSSQAATGGDSEGKHFYKCATCGEMVDKRQLDQVLYHETDHKPRPDIQYSGGERLV
jgi:hypothetical protein